VSFVWLILCKLSVCFFSSGWSPGSYSRGFFFPSSVLTFRCSAVSTISSREKSQLSSTATSTTALAGEESIESKEGDNFQCELADGYTCKIDG
jgi:hypothetical protein